MSTITQMFAEASVPLYEYFGKIKLLDFTQKMPSYKEPFQTILPNIYYGSCWLYREC